MKITQTFFAIAILLFAFIAPCSAVHKAPKDIGIERSKLDKKKAAKLDKKLQKLERKIDKKIAKAEAEGVDFQDPVEKWFWFWIFGWGIAIILGIIGLGTFATIFAVAGFVALVLWLVNKFS